MRIRNILFIFIFIGGCYQDVRGINNPEPTQSAEFAVQHNDSVINFVEQKIMYYAPQSGSVYLVWNSENYPKEECVLWNDNTTLTEGLLYNPMEARGDTFSIKLRVPIWSTIQYYFWITKNKEGHYQDFWDLQSSGQTTMSDATVIIKNAVYSKKEEKKEPQILSFGWLILVFVIFAFALLYWVQKKWVPEAGSSAKIEKVLFLGLSLAAFHALARSEIINYNFVYIIYNPKIIVNIIRGSFNDFLFVSSLVLIFVLIIRWLKSSKVKNIVYGIFLFIAIFSTLVAFINITTVIFLGKPFTYQWLYYSDFLGSNEAKTAMQENLSVFIAFNLLSYCISMLVFAGVLQFAYRLLSIKKQLKYITFLLVGFIMIPLLVLVFKSNVTWTKGQSENAITSMLYSIYTANSNSSFYNAEIPIESSAFNPAECTEIKTPLNDSLKGHKVKNVVFIILESAGAVYFDEFGGTYQLSPNLNKYAKHSVIFDQMYAHAPATNRSLVSILGSMYPFLSYKSLTQEAPDVKHPTISSVLKNQGYRTSFFSSADLRFQNCREFLDHRGFDVIEDFATINCFEKFQLESSDYVEGNGIDDLCLADRLDSWIEEDSSRHFFTMIWTVQGHYPYFFADQEEDFGVSNFSFNRYLNCLKHNDELIGKVMQSLEDKGLASTTLVVVVGDHGEAFGQHNQYGHGTAIYEENLRVPLYFINADLFRGERKNDIAGMKDLATTTLSVIDIEIPKEWQGRDLLSTSSNEAFYFAPWSDYLFGYRKDNMKYIFNESQNTLEVFDLSKDPNEKINLYQSITKEEIEDARNRVGAWVQFQDKYVKEMLK